MTERTEMVLHYGDLTDSACLIKIINEVRMIPLALSFLLFCRAAATLSFALQMNTRHTHTHTLTHTHTHTPLQARPDEVYNLGAMSHVKVSFDMAEYTGNVDGASTLSRHGVSSPFVCFCSPATGFVSICCDW